MRILHVVHRFPCLSETFVADRIEGLAARGWEPTVFASEAGPGPSATGSAVPVRYAPPRPRERGRRAAAALRLLAAARGGRSRLLRTLRADRYGRWALGLDPMFRAAACAQGESYDAVHGHFGPAALSAAILGDAGILHGPLVASFYGYDASGFPGAWGGDVYRFLFARAERVVAGTERMRERLVTLGCARERIALVRLGVDVSRIAFHAGGSSSGGPLRLVAVARLVEKKGLDDALRATVRARAEGVDAELTIVGDGPLRERLEALRDELGLARAVTFAGALPRADVIRALGAAEVFILPSRTARDGDADEAPVAILEAMAVGLPVVATRHGAIPEAVADGVTGLLADEGDAPALAAHIARLANDPALRARMGAAGRRVVEERFDLCHALDALGAVHEACAGR